MWPVTDSPSGLTHLNASGEARMVDVSAKDVTASYGDGGRSGAAVARLRGRPAGRFGAQG